MSDTIQNSPAPKQQIKNPVSLLIGYFKSKFEACCHSIDKRRKQKQAIRAQRLAVRRQKIEELRKRSWIYQIREKLFVLLDYDPTVIYSGDAGEPTFIGAISQWFYRVFWTRRIELTGVVLLGVIGWYCYASIIGNNSTNQQVIRMGDTAASQTSSDSRNDLSMIND